VLAEEKKWADEANRDRLKARLKVVFWGVIGLGLPLLALVLVVWLYVKYGREPKAQFQAQYLRDVPQPPLPPALVAYIWNMGSVGNTEVTATLLALINRKVIDIERVTVHKERLFGKDDTVTYRLPLHGERLEELLPYERNLVAFLFNEIAEGSTLVLSELRELAKKKRQTFASGYSTWKKMAEDEGERRGYLDAKADRMAFVGATFSFIGIVAAAAAGIFGSLWFFIGVIVCIVLIRVSRTIKRRSLEAAELHAQYAALERYMKDFGRLQEKPPDAVVLWEQFLVYAVVFGIADQVVRDMAVKVPEVVQDPAFRSSYFLWYGVPGEGGGMAAFSELHQSFSQAVSVATSSSSSGAGGGGGFSGGGGGGGGGGGFGAG